MNDWLHFNGWLAGDFSYRLVVTLLHFIWQAAILGVVANAITRMLRRRNARHAYGVNVAFLASMVLVATFTFALVRAPEENSVRSNSPPFPAIANSTAGVSRDQAESTAISEPTTSPIPTASPATSRSLFALRETLTRWSRPITVCYLIAVSVMLMRIGRGVWRAKVLRRDSISIERADLLAIAEETADRIGLAVTPALAWCEQVSTPIVVGLLRPMILLPAAMIGGLTTQQLESILAHEMAHIRRFDLPINLFQRIVESMFFFHPAVWFVSRNIDIEREKATDDFALNAGCEPVRYADALLRMAELSAATRKLVDRFAVPAVEEGVALAATGKKPSELKRRIARLVESDSPTKIRSRYFNSASLGAVLFLVTLLTCIFVVNGRVLMAAYEETKSTFWQAVNDGDTEKAKSLLAQDRSLAGLDFRPTNEQDPLTDGFPLVVACEKGNYALAKLLLEHGADVNAKSPTEEQQEFGMPLHLAVADGHYKIANLLLDHDASLHGHGWCTAATFEQVYDAAVQEGGNPNLVWRAFSRYLDDDVIQTGLAGASVDEDSPDVVRLFDRMLSLGAEPSHSMIVRAERHALIRELLQTRPTSDGSRHDHPRGTVFHDISGAASWYGYPKTIKMCMEECPHLYSADIAKRVIDRAIRSHNRDGSWQEYRDMIKSQLNFLKDTGELDAWRDEGFNPIFALAHNYCWPNNYGFKAGVSTPEGLLAIAQMFLDYGFEVDIRDAESGKHAIEEAIEREVKGHPGMKEYIAFLKENGAS